MSWTPVVPGRPEAVLALAGLAFVTFIGLYFLRGVVRTAIDEWRVIYREAKQGWADKHGKNGA